jgi:hypothetical protein
LRVPFRYPSGLAWESLGPDDRCPLEKDSPESIAKITADAWADRPSRLDRFIKALRAEQKKRSAHAG